MSQVHSELLPPGASVRSGLPAACEVSVAPDGTVWVVLDSDEDGDLTVDVMPRTAGHVAMIHARRSGAGSGGVERTGAGPGDAIRDGDGDGTALRDGIGAGSAIRTGEGDGWAYRLGSGDGDAVRLGSGAGGARRKGAGVGEERTLHSTRDSGGAAAGMTAF